MSKVAIVTGGGTGLGAAVALEFSRRGARVAINYSRSRDQAEATAELCRQSGVEAITVQGDVGNDEDCQRIVSTTISKFGAIDVLVNNAGATKKVPHTDLDGLSGEDFLNVYQTNVVGTYQMIRACAPHMKRAGSGSVVNISSASAEIGLGTSIAYSASKAALNTLTRSLARVLGPEIRVNAVSPGFMATRWFSDELDAEAMGHLVNSQRSASVLKRVGTPEEVAASVVFLAGDDAVHVTGVNLFVEGGSLLGAVPPNVN